MLVWFVMLAAIYLAAGCGQETGSRDSGGEDRSGRSEVTLLLDWYPNANHAGIYWTEEQGYWSDQGLQVEVLVPSDPSSALKQVAAGKSDFAVSYETEVMLARAQGLPVRSVMALVQRPLGALMMLEESPIAKPSDLRGKRIGSPGTAASDAVLQTLLEQNGVGLDEVEVINTGYDLLPALLGGKVDAIIGAFWNWESVQAELQGKPVKWLHVEEWGIPDHNTLVLVASDKMITGRPEVVRRFVHALVRSYEELIQDPRGALQILLEANPELDEELTRRALELTVPVFQHDAPRVGFHDPDEWRFYKDWMMRAGLLSREIDVEGTFTNEFLP